MLNSVTVTRLRAGIITDRYGDTVEDWTNPTRADLAGTLAPHVSTEDIEPGRSPVVTGWTLLLPGTTADVTARDRFEIDGQLWAVDGDPAAWTWPFGGLAGTEIQLGKVQG